LIPSTQPDQIVQFNTNPITDSSEALSVLQELVATTQDSALNTAATDAGNSVYQPSETAFSTEDTYSTSSDNSSDADSGGFLAVNEAVSSEAVSSEAAEVIA
ncbi:MAG: hypothetical protein QF702_08360, partial [Prochlorococcaceae cyanobacterium ETNP2_MAG_10]|nr:hypothetical protein [Prochlorococcaceae cyanobacterium ETNP2_MAG_10]